MKPHHRRLPGHWALVSGRAPPDAFGFKSDKLQIIYNHTSEPWRDAAPHAHGDSDEVYIVLEGVMSVDVAGTVADVRAGEVLCVPAGTRHQLVDLTTPHRSFVVRSPSIDDKILPDHDDPCLVVTRSEAIRALRREGRHEEACTLAVELAARAPGDAELQYQAACVHDHLGREAEAVPFYRAALAGNLEPEALRGAYLGLGSTYRTLGRYVEAKATLEEGLARFPEANEMKVFLAMALHNLGDSKQAIESLLMVLAETSNDASVQAYREAIRFHAGDIDRSWL